MAQIDEFELRRALAPYAFDGTEAIAAIITLLDAFSAHSHPQALAGAIRKILMRQYADCVPIDAVIAHYDGGGR